MEPVAAGKMSTAGTTSLDRAESLREMDRERARRVRVRILGTNSTLVSLFQSCI